MKSIADLVLQTQSGNQDAFAELVRRFQDMATGYALSLLGDVHLAEDVAQEAFTRAYLDLVHLKEPAAFPGWFRKIVFKYSDRIRRQRTTTMSVDDLEEVLPDKETSSKTLEKNELEVQIHSAIQSLPEVERQVATLFYFGNHSREAIAIFLDIPKSTVVYRLRSARQKLKKRMLDMTDQILNQDIPSKDDRFVNQVTTTSLQRKTIYDLHDQFVAQLSPILSDVMGKTVGLHLRFVDMTSHGHVLKAITSYPTCSYAFTLEPNGGQAMLSTFTSFPLALMGVEDFILNRLDASYEPRYLTDTEVSDFHPCALKMIDTLNSVWSSRHMQVHYQNTITQPETIDWIDDKDDVVLLGLQVFATGFGQRELNPKSSGAIGTSPAIMLSYPLKSLESILATF